MTKRAAAWTWVARGLVAAAIVVVLAGGLIARVVFEGERELRTAEALSSSGQLSVAAVHARRSAAWYAPGAPHVAEAHRRLILIARLAEARGQPDVALFAWRQLRAAVHSSRSILAPPADVLMLANASIARLVAAKPLPSGQAADHDAERRALEHLGRAWYPRAPLTVAMLAGFVALAAGLTLMALRLTADGVAAPWRALRPGAVVAVIGFACWMLALWKA